MDCVQSILGRVVICEFGCINKVVPVVFQLVVVHEAAKDLLNRAVGTLRLALVWKW